MAALKRKFEIPKTKLYINKLRLNRFRECHAKSSRRYKQCHVVARSTGRATVETPETRMNEWGRERKGAPTRERRRTKINETIQVPTRETRERETMLNEYRTSAYIHMHVVTLTDTSCATFYGVYLGVATNICM